MPQFTAETAAAMALRSWEARRLKQQAEEQAAPIPQPAAETLTPDVDRVRAKLDKLDSLMDSAEDDRQWDCYSRAYERMFRVWCTLTKTPGPGNLKPSSKAQTRAPAMPQPSVSSPTPESPAG